MMAGKVERFLVDRRGDDAADHAGFGITHRLFDEAEGRVAGDGRQRAPWQRCAFDRQINDVRGKIDIDVERLAGCFQRRQVAVDTGIGAVRVTHFGQRPNRDFRSDAAGVTHGDADDIAHDYSPTAVRELALAQPGARRTYLMARL